MWLSLLTTQQLFAQQNVSEETGVALEETFWCGEYFMKKVASWWLEFNRFFNDPYFIFKDCDWTEQRVFIACGCGATGYEISKYGRIYQENEKVHPQLDKLIRAVEEALRVWWLIVEENENGEIVYRVYCL